MKRKHSFFIVGLAALMLFTLTSCGESAVTKLKNGTDGTAGTKAKYVEFGLWPQTKAASDVTIDESEVIETPTGFHCYKGSDGELYLRRVASPYKEHCFDDGTPIVDGQVYYFKMEPIKWRVLTKKYIDANGENKGNLLLSEKVLYILSYFPYQYKDDERNIKVTEDDGSYKVFHAKNNNYEFSKVRAFLNGHGYVTPNHNLKNTYKGAGFLYRAFTEEERNLISDTLVDNSLESTADVDGKLAISKGMACRNTKDKVFLLSEKEVTSKDYGFPACDVEGPDSCRQRACTDYAKAVGASPAEDGDFKGYAAWWLRSPHRDMNGAREVKISGIATGGGRTTFNYGIVPAIAIEF